MSLFEHKILSSFITIHQDTESKRKKIKIISFYHFLAFSLVLYCTPSPSTLPLSVIFLHFLILVLNDSHFNMYICPTFSAFFHCVFTYHLLSFVVQCSFFSYSIVFLGGLTHDYSPKYNNDSTFICVICASSFLYTYIDCFFDISLQWMCHKVTLSQMQLGSPLLPYPNITK